MSRAGHLGFGVALLRGLLARYIVAGFPGCIVRIGSFRGRAGETGKRRRMAGRILTGGGGGMLRDMLVSEVPAVLRGELYASAALAGTAAVVIARLLHLPTLADASSASSFGIWPFGVAGGCHPD